MTKKLDPNAFNFADWFGDANRPEESADVFTRNGLVGEINALQRQIEEDDRAADPEGSLGDEAVSANEEKLAELLQEFLDSKVTVYVKALTPGERTSVRKAHEASKQPDEDFVIRILAASITALRKPGKERTPVSMSYGDILKLAEQIGDAQIEVLFNAYRQATSGLPTVDADFLLKRSGPANTPE
ncbi:hypothetical protein ABIB35_001490 [Arthrobacter sp. UYP6]|uniref:hypothetical protein n=1 Tax=Arthrobacter sp. UYP6 TaxID=1756378 RepID=UPI00339825F9